MKRHNYPSHAPTPVARPTRGDPYNTADEPKTPDVLEFELADTIEVIVLSCEPNL